MSKFSLTPDERYQERRKVKGEREGVNAERRGEGGGLI